MIGDSNYWYSQFTEMENNCNNLRSKYLSAFGRLLEVTKERDELRSQLEKDYEYSYVEGEEEPNYSDEQLQAMEELMNPAYCY